MVNVGSSAGHFPAPLMSIYSATKVYVDYLSRAVEYETRGSGVDVLTLTPMYICTRMTAYSNLINRPSLFVPDAATPGPRRAQRLCC